MIIIALLSYLVLALVIGRVMYIEFGEMYPADNNLPDAVFCGIISPLLFLLLVIVLATLAICKLLGIKP